MSGVVDVKKFLEALKNRCGEGQLDLNAVQEVLQSTATEAESSGGSCVRNLNEGNLDQDASKVAVLPSISSRSCVNSSGSEGELCRKRGSTEDNEPAVKPRKKPRRVSVISSESDEDEHTTTRGERELKGKPSVKSSRKSRRKSILSSESDSDEHMRRCARKDTLPIVQSSKQKNKHPVTPESEDDKPRIESGDKSDTTPSDHNPKSFKRASANIELPSKRKSLKIDAGLMEQRSPGSKKQSFKKGGRRQSTSNSESNPESDVGGSLTLYKKSGCESKSENSSIPTTRQVEHKRVKKLSPSGTKSLPSTHNTTADLQDKSPKSEDLIESNADTPVKNVIRETMIESHQKKSKKSPEFKQSLYPTKTLPKTQKVSGGLQHSTKAPQKQKMECEKDEKDTETSGASELDISLYVKPCSVIVPKLSKEALAELSPSKSNAIKQEKLLKEVAADTRKSESRLVPDKSKVSMNYEFLKPALPPRFASTSSVSNTKTQKKSKRTSQPNKLAKPKESRAQKDLKKPSESRIRAPITDFSDYHVPQQRLQPMDKLEQESEELDYEPLIEDDDIISICADTTIFRNYNVDDDIPEKKYTCDVDNDSVASCGSDDVARLSDVEEESYVDHLNEVPADAQDELDVKTRSEMNILAESPQKENVLGIPVEDYSCVRIRKKRDSVESGELCDEDSHSEPEKDESETNKMTENAISEMQGGSSYFETNQSNYDKESSLKLSGLKECAENLSQNIETVRKADVRGQKATPSKGKKTPSPAKKSDILGKHDSSSHLQTKRCNKEKENSPKLKSINECSRSLSKTIQTVPKGDDRRQKKTPSKANKPVSPDKDKPSINTKISDLICLENNPISNMQLEEDCHANPPPVTNQRGYKPNRVMQPAISPRNIKDTTKLDQLDIGSDQRMRKMEFPGVHFDPPKRGPLIHSPRDQGIALLKTPDIPPNSALYCRPVSVSPQEAPILTANVAPVASLNQTQSNTQLMDRPVSTFSHIMRNEGETSVPNLASSKSLPATSPSHRSLLGIQPLQEQSHGLGFRDADLCQGGSNYTSLQGPRKAVADDPENILMQYCQEYLTNGICKLEKCKKLHEFPKLTFDDGCCKQRTVDLIHKMISYPFWRERWFYLALETLGNYGDIQIIKFLVLKFWIHKTESKTAQLPSLHDDIYWSHFGRAFALCGLGPSRCLKKILNPVLSYKKDALPNHCYHFIDNIVDALFHEYIENQSDLWNGLMELASLKDYEIPANVMREILKDTLKSPKNTVEQAEICQYLLTSRAFQPRKPEEWVLMHLIHQLFMVLQRSEKNKPLAQKLADHFQISTNNKCCAAYQLSIEEANVVAVQNKRFALAPPAIPSFCNESGVYLNNNNPCNLLPRADVETTTYNQRVAPLNGPYEGAVISIPEAVNAQGVMNLKAASTSSHDLDSLESVPSTPIKSMDLKIIVGPSGNSRTVSSKAEPSPQKSSASCREQGNPNIKANPLGVEAPKSNGKGETRTVSSKVEPSPQKSSAPYREQGNPNIKANPLGVKAPKSNEKEDSFLDHLRNKRFGKASSFILCWIPNPSSMKRGIEVAITHLVSLDSKTRIEHLKTLFMAVKSRMSSSGPKDEPLKGIMIQIAVPILHNFLKEQCPIEAQAVHDILWKFTDPSSAKVQKYSPSFCKLVTAWVFIANGNVKDALDIVISNAFHSFKEHWKVPSQPTDLKLRDEVCAEIFNFCTTKDPHVEQAEKLFRLMLKAKGSYGIDVTQFFDIILRELVKLSKIQTAANLVAWAFKEYGLKPGERVNRLLLANFTAYPDNSKLSPDIVHIVQQEPYDQALPQSIEGLSRVDVCLPSVWNKIEIYSILKFLFACHLSNLPTHREIPDIAVVIKERSLSTIQGESLFSDSLDDIDPSVPAMQERVNEVIPRLLNHNKSTFENGSLVLDKQSVQDCVAEHRRDQDRGPFGQRPRPTSSRDNRPISSGRRHIDAPFLHHAPESYGRWPNHESPWGHGHPQYNAYSNDTYHNYPPPPNGRHYPRGDRYNWSRYKTQRPY